MSSRQLLFKTFYRLGFVPWDGHPLAKSLTGPGRGRRRPGAGHGVGPRLRHRRQLHLPGQARLAGHRRGLRRQGGRQGPREGGGQQGRRQLRPRRRDAAELRGHRVELRSDRRQRLPARHERRGSRRLRARGHRGGGARTRGCCSSSSSPAGPSACRASTRTRSSGGSPTDWTLLSSGSEPAMDHNGKDPARYYLFARAS